MAFNDSLDVGKPEARSALRGFGREEGVKYAVEDIARDPGSGVAYGQHDILTRRGARNLARSGCIQDPKLRFKGQFAAVGHRIAGVDAQVYEHVMQLRGIAQDARNARAWLNGQPYILGKARLQDLHDFGDQVRRLEREMRAQAELERERAVHAERLRAYEDAEAGLREAFQSLSAEALKSNNRAFLDLAETRLNDARAQAVAEPTEPMAHTKPKDPNARFTFSYPTLEGKTLTESDFAGKVLLVSVTGSWCPNCHDEAPFLSELYKGYHDQGLEIVAFAFEEEAQLKDPVRLRAFIRNFAITYPVVLVGQPEQLAEKVPQAENLNAFPTTLFIGRDGRIRAIHAGFASKATGEFYGKGKDEMTAIVKDLLAEPAVSRTN